MKTKQKKLHYFLAPIYVIAYMLTIGIITNLITL